MKKLLTSIFLSVALIVGIGVFTVPTTGCNVTASEIQNDGQAVANALLSVAKIEAASNPILATNLTTAANSLLQVTTNWQTGSTIALINDAANACEVALAAIPQTAAIAPLVPIAIAAIDILVADVQSSSGSSTPATLVKVPDYYVGYKVHHRLLRSPEGDFKSAWNGVVKQHPSLSSAAIK